MMNNIKILMRIGNSTVLEDASTFSEVVIINMLKSFSKFHNVTVDVIKEIDMEFALNLKKDKYDFIFAPGVRYFSKVSSEIIKILKEKVKYELLQTYDAQREDDDIITFAFSNPDKCDGINSVYIDWCADNTKMKPEKNNNVLTILVDHPNYIDDTDTTNLVYNELLKFKNNKQYKNEYKNIDIKFLTSSGIKSIDDFENTEYNRQSISHLEMIKLYNKSHIFIMTHKESLGLSAIESNMSGCLILKKSDFLRTCRLENLTYYDYDSEFDWDIILSKINPLEIRSKVVHQNWDNIVIKIYNYLIKKIENTT